VDYQPAAAALTSSKPVIHGTPRVGRTLRVRHGHWSPGTRFTYTWYAGGTVVEHATSARLKLTQARKGLRIKVRVTGAKPGYPTASRTSVRTSKVT
jgi:hypothetical protein